MRLFVAITPPATALAGIDAAVAPLRAARPELTWSSPQSWHVTLAFLGEVDDAVVPRLAVRLERAAGGHPRLELSTAGAGAFPTVPRARVLWTGVRGDPAALREMSGSVASGSHGARARRRPASGGGSGRTSRWLAPGSRPIFRPLVTALADYSGPAWTADRIAPDPQLPGPAAPL